MWMVLPTKDCKCATCEKLREVVDEAGTLKVPEPSVLKPGDTTGIRSQIRSLEKEVVRLGGNCCDHGAPACDACATHDTIAANST